MRYLLDTHTAIWAISNKDLLSNNATSITDDVCVALCISVVSAWELAIKVSINKLNFDGGVNSFFEKMSENGIELIGVKDSYVRCVESLPFHHRDPFDRLLIATAISENLTIITADANIQKYDVQWIW